MEAKSDGPEFVLISRFGLTPAEARVALAIGHGKSPTAIAKARGISVKTIRTQLKAVFAKTGTHRQAELATLLHRMSL